MTVAKRDAVRAEVAAAIAVRDAEIRLAYGAGGIVTMEKLAGHFKCSASTVWCAVHEKSPKASPPSDGRHLSQDERIAAVWRAAWNPRN